MRSLFGSIPLLAALSLASCQPAGGPQQQAAAGSAALPDWSGVWALVDDSFWQANLDAYQNDVGLTPKFEAIRAKARADRAQANQAKCLPAGASAMFQHGMLYEIYISPKKVLFAFEDGETRRIRTDGSPHRPIAELRNSYVGDSIGHWEGQTLVVDTIGFPNGELWQNHGVRATINTHLEEKFFINKDGLLQIDSVMTDPEIFARPYAFTRLNKRQNLELYEAACLQNNRDTGSEIDLTPPEE